MNLLNKRRICAFSFIEKQEKEKKPRIKSSINGKKLLQNAKYLNELCVCLNGIFFETPGLKHHKIDIYYMFVYVYNADIDTCVCVCKRLKKIL